jgi:hypothetical protein
MATTEHTINDALASALGDTRRSWRVSPVVRSENTGALKGNTKRPDILIIEPNVSPVVIEIEIEPAATVEQDAVQRLGQVIRKTGRTILSSIAVRLPLRLRERAGNALRREICDASDLQMALYTGSEPSSASRWPKLGWIRGGVADLSVLAQSASVPPDVINAAADLLVDGVREAAGLLGEMAATHPTAVQKIAFELHQEDGEQTRRMAATILANAFVFQESLAGGPGELAVVGSIEELRTANELSKFSIIAEWRNILKVNYWPIFDIARRILEMIPT